MGKLKIAIGIVILVLLGFAAKTYLFDKQEPQSTQKQVSLFYYSPNKDKDASGNILCSRQGLVEVKRQVPANSTIADTIKLLLQGNLSESERSSGITSEYPLPGLELTSAETKNGVLTLQFSDPQNKTSGGSCRVGILWAQIEATAKQFSGVTEVKFQPLELFQP